MWVATYIAVVTELPLSQFGLLSLILRWVQSRSSPEPLCTTLENTIKFHTNEKALRNPPQQTITMIPTNSSRKMSFIPALATVRFILKSTVISFPLSLAFNACMIYHAKKIPNHPYKPSSFSILDLLPTRVSQSALNSLEVPHLLCNGAQPLVDMETRATIAFRVGSYILKSH